MRAKSKLATQRRRKRANERRRALREQRALAAVDFFATSSGAALAFPGPGYRTDLRDPYPDAG